MIHEIINPSDKYTIECDDMKLLTATIFILGEGMYSTSSKETDFKVPITVFGPVDGLTFFKETFGEDLSVYIQKNKSLLSDCLWSVCLGDETQREYYFSELNKRKTDEEKDIFIKKYYDKNQSSMNDIGGRAIAFSRMLKKQIQEEK